ncbi:hypothetical protein Ancab_007288 [Ancistrocladus abbreviatus]
MWYLSRTPRSYSKSQLNDSLYFHLRRNSIFPLTESGVPDEISIVVDTTTAGPAAERLSPDQPPENITGNTQWQWFAYQDTQMEFRAIAVPRTPSTQIQVIAILPDYFLCAKIINSPSNEAVLCTYSRKSNLLEELPEAKEEEEKEEEEGRDIMSAACAIVNGWLYIAGGYKKGYSSAADQQATPLNSAQRLNLKKLKWKSLPPMLKARTHASGVAHGGKFYVIGDGNFDRSAEVYNTTTKSWQQIARFVPKEADGYAVTSNNEHIVLLTWSDYLGVKLWRWGGTGHPLGPRWQLLRWLQSSKVYRDRLHQHGARMVQFGKEILILVGLTDGLCWVGGSCTLPVLPPPWFRPRDAQQVLHYEHVDAVSLRAGGRSACRQIPVYKISNGLIS